MTWPIQPVGYRPQGTPRVDPLERTAPNERREHEDDRGQHHDHEQREQPQPPVADGDGHIDVLA